MSIFITTWVVIISTVGFVMGAVSGVIPLIAAVVWLVVNN